MGNTHTLEELEFTLQGQLTGCLNLFKEPVTNIEDRINLLLLLDNCLNTISKQTIGPKLDHYGRLTNTSIPMEGMPWNIPGGVHSPTHTTSEEFLTRDALYRMTQVEDPN